MHYLQLEVCPFTGSYALFQQAWPLHGRDTEFVSLAGISAACLLALHTRRESSCLFLGCFHCYLLTVSSNTLSGLRAAAVCGLRLCIKANTKSSRSRISFSLIHNAKIVTLHSGFFWDSPIQLQFIEGQQCVAAGWRGRNHTVSQYTFGLWRSEETTMQSRHTISHGVCMWEHKKSPVGSELRSI